MGDNQGFDFLFVIGTVSVTNGVMSVFGAIGNLISIRTFIKIGANDGVTVSFLLLSFFDFLFLISVKAATVTHVLYLIEESSSFRIYFPIDPYGVNTYFTNVGSLLYLINLLLVTYMAVVKCLCVASPVYFRHSFNTKTTKITVALIVFFSVLSCIPFFVIREMVLQFDGRINVTRPTLHFATFSSQVVAVAHPLMGTALPIITQVVMSICACIMAHYLRNSLAFRNKRTHLFSEDHDLVETKQLSKELRAIQQTFLITTVFIVGNLPKVLFNSVKFFLPDYSLDRTNSFLISFFEMIRVTFQVLNSSTNIFIYYNYNSKFKTYCFK